MQLTQQRSLFGAAWFAWIKSFSVWSFTLTVCLLVVGFPAIAILATAGLLLAIALQSVLPASAVLLVSGGLLGGCALAILGSSAALTLRGIHPHEVHWLHWLHGKTSQLESATYAACPLTCNLTQAG